MMAANRPKEQQPGEEMAVVYEDELPWNEDKGICFEIREIRKLLPDVAAMEYTWVISFGKGRDIYYTKLVYDSVKVSKGYIDRMRIQARLDILYRAHRDGLI